jgi:hypothetical protein
MVVQICSSRSIAAMNSAVPLTNSAASAALGGAAS